MEHPVVIIIYRRPKETADLMRILQNVCPRRLYVVADYPQKPELAAACAEALKIASHPAWPCEVQLNVAKENLGCRRRVSTGLDWVFERENSAIILEDDLLPSPSFFPYAGELLDRYRDDARIMHISGNNHQNGISRGPASYTFSKHTHCWGWATWRRAWRHYEHDMQNWPAFRSGGYLERVCPDPLERAYFRGIFDKVAAGKIDSWAYIWTYSCWKENGLGINPECNLVANQGYGEHATHTRNPAAQPELNTTDLAFPLIHPDIMAPCELADRYTFYHHFGGNAIVEAKSIAGKVRQYYRGLKRRIYKS